MQTTTISLSVKCYAWRPFQGKQPLQHKLLVKWRIYGILVYWGNAGCVVMLPEEKIMNAALSLIITPVHLSVLCVPSWQGRIFSLHCAAGYQQLLHSTRLVWPGLSAVPAGQTHSIQTCTDPGQMR